MKFLKFALIMFFLINLKPAKVFASELSTIKTTIQSIENAVGVESDYSVYSHVDGRIYWVPGARVDLVNQLKEAWLLNEEVQLTIIGDETIDKVISLGFAAEEEIENYPAKDLSEHDIINDNSQYQMTSLTLDQATILFNSLNSRDTSNSQCYKRAHVWAYDMSLKGINSMKVFLFYTRKFNRDCGNRQLCKWWFHVAPLVMVDGQEMVLDREFMKAPLPLKEWYSFTDFIGAYERGTGTTNTICPVIKSYVDYERNLYTGICYLRIVPMYYYDPRSVSLSDKSRGPVRTQFNTFEVRSSQRDFLE